MRHTFICQCHGRGSHSRSQVHRIRTHYFSQSECKSRVAIKQLKAGIDEWVIDKADLQHNHQPHSVDFMVNNKTKEITEEQRNFIASMYNQNNQINGSELRKAYRMLYPDEPDMFAKKVQNLLQDLRKGKQIIKNQSPLPLSNAKKQAE